MSDFPTQDSAPGQLSGGDNFVDQRRGNEYNQQFPLTGAKAVEVNNDQAARTVKPDIAAGAGSRPPESVSGLNAGSGRAINVKCVDCKTIVGSHPGDHRAPSRDTAKESLGRAADNGGPRKRVGQFANNGKTPQDVGFQRFPGDTADNDD
jgi:hypothetical protein